MLLSVVSEYVSWVLTLMSEKRLRSEQREAVVKSASVFCSLGNPWLSTLGISKIRFPTDTLERVAVTLYLTALAN